MSPVQLASRETMAKVPETVSARQFNLVRLHLIGKEVIPLELCDPPGRCPLTMQSVYDSTRSRWAD